MADSTGHRPDDIAYLTALVREQDRPRYYATLFAPAHLRADLVSIFGFAAEVARVPGAISEAQLGEIRLKWWQDSLAAAVQEGGEAPAVRALATTIPGRRLPTAAFDALVEATRLDLYSDPPETDDDLEGRLGETQSALFQMAAIVLGAGAGRSADAAGHAGLAYGLATRLAAFAVERSRGRCILPATRLSAHGLSPGDVYSAPAPAALGSVIAEMVEHARRHLAEARLHIAELPKDLRPAFLPLAVVPPLLRRVERAGQDILVRQRALSDIGMLVRIARAGWFRR